MTQPTKAALEEAKTLVYLAVKDHDDGGYAFAGMYEILGNRIATALTAAKKKTESRCMQEVSYCSCPRCYGI